MRIDGLKLGHYTNESLGTGVTVFLFDQPSPCGWFLCGHAPATRDVSLLEPTSTVSAIDALAFTGGSAKGLAVTDGVMAWLEQHSRGLRTCAGLIPIVPTASIYDLAIAEPVAPTVDDAYSACQQASYDITQYGNVGVGTGASVGKLLAGCQPMPGGFGYADLQMTTGLTVVAFAVVNCVGDVLERNGEIVAGALNDSGDYGNVSQSLLAGEQMTDPGFNTTLIAVICNARLDKTALTLVARMASAGVARAIVPSFTTFDGDVVFAAATGVVDADINLVGMLAAEATRQAIVKAVRN